MRLALLASALVVLAVPATAGAHTASISGGTANAEWSEGRVDNLLLGMEHCDGDPSCQWEAVAGVVPTSRGYCPADWAAGGSVGFATFWHSGYRVGDGAVQSGPQQFPLDGTAGQRVCLYLERVLSGGGRESTLWLTKRLTGPAGPPAEDPELTVEEAREEARRALAKRFDRRFKRGHRRKLDCLKRSESQYDCPVKWVHRDRRYKGDVLVTMLPDGSVATDVDVSRHRLR